MTFLAGKREYVVILVCFGGGVGNFEKVYKMFKEKNLSNFGQHYHWDKKWDE